MKEICQNKDFDTPEKTFFSKKRVRRVFERVSDVCAQNRESLASVLGNMCAFKDQEAQGIVMDVVDNPLGFLIFESTHVSKIRKPKGSPRDCHGCC